LKTLTDNGTVKTVPFVFSMLFRLSSFTGLHPKSIAFSSAKEGFRSAFSAPLQHAARWSRCVSAGNIPGQF
jgi:hypothetical protein